jgi:uncharacterized protein YbjT (DUF2867 family)
MRPGWQPQPHVLFGGAMSDFSHPPLVEEYPLPPELRAIVPWTFLSLVFVSLIDGSQRTAPVSVWDATGVLVRAALDPDAPTGTCGLGRPEVLTLDEMLDLLNARSVKKRHLPGPVDRVMAHLAPSLNPSSVDVLLADSLPSPPLAAEAFKVQIHSPREVIKR